MRRRPIALPRNPSHAWWPMLVNCVLVAITLRRMMRLSLDPSPDAERRIMGRPRNRAVQR